MEKIEETKPEQIFESITCFQCKQWKPMIQESETPQETYEAIIRERNASGKILGACLIGGFPMFDIEACSLKGEYRHLSERVEQY